MSWVRQADYLSRKDSVRSNQELLEKATRLKLEMAAYSQVRYGARLNIMLNKYEESKLSKLVLVNKLMLGQNCWKELGSEFKGTTDDFDWWILLVPFLLFSHSSHGWLRPTISQLT